MFFFTWPSSLSASPKCAPLLHSAPAENLLDLVTPCKVQSAKQYVWGGVVISLLLLAYRVVVTRSQRSKQEREVAPYSLWIAIAPYAIALLYALVAVSTAQSQYAKTLATFKASGLSASEWVNARIQDHRSRATVLTSIASSSIIAAASLANARYSRQTSFMLAEGSTRSFAARRGARAPDVDRDRSEERHVGASNAE
jgi:hypothetical protein